MLSLMMLKMNEELEVRAEFRFDFHSSDTSLDVESENQVRTELQKLRSCKRNKPKLCRHRDHIHILCGWESWKMVQTRSNSCRNWQVEEVVVVDTFRRHRCEEGNNQQLRFHCCIVGLVVEEVVGVVDNDVEGLMCKVY